MVKRKLICIHLIFHDYTQSKKKKNLLNLELLKTLRLFTLLLFIPREPYISEREKFVSPFYEREKELGGYFDNEVARWERAFAYESNREKLQDYLKDIPVRENEWDSRHVPYELANAEHLAMSDSVGMINLSHFPIMDIEGPDAEKMLEYLSVAKVGGKYSYWKSYIHKFS
jgi:hypothetical protein